MRISFILAIALIVGYASSFPAGESDSDSSLVYVSDGKTDDAKKVFVYIYAWVILFIWIQFRDEIFIFVFVYLW